MKSRLTTALVVVTLFGTAPLGRAQGPQAASTPAVANCPAGLAERLTSEVTPWLDTINLSGVVVVACQGQPVYSIARGQANRATSATNALDTRFNLGSMNKMWTAIAVAQLVEQGRIDLKAPVGRYLSTIANPVIRDQVQIHHLLTHTSGLGMYFTRGFLRDRVYANRASDYLPFFIEDAPEFTPGARMRYSNAGFALLGAIVEAVSGFGEGTLNGWRHVGHNGGMPGVGTEFLSFPDHGIDIVVLTNMDMPTATQVMTRVSRIVLGADSRRL